MDFDTQVKLKIYETVAETTHIPSAADVAHMLNASIEKVAGAFERLHQKRLIVPEPSDPLRIRMAPPFSAVETPFPVRVQTQTYYGNCVWDALGVAVALHKDAVIPARDAHSNESIELKVVNGAVLPHPCVIHFAVPAALWWKDVIYT